MMVGPVQAAASFHTDTNLILGQHFSTK